MKLWKRNAVVAAIVLFVCAAVYLNWSYSKEAADGGKEGEGGKLLLEKAKAGTLQQTVSMTESVEAPVKAGDSLGVLTVTAGDEVVAEIPILAGEEVPRITYGQMLLRTLKMAFFVRLKIDVKGKTSRRERFPGGFWHPDAGNVNNHQICFFGLFFPRSYGIL